MKTYCGIGSRQTPTDVLNVMWAIGSELAREGWTLRSGGAVGADTAFEKGCMNQSGTREIYVPWKGFAEGIAVDGLDNYAEATKIAEKFHPRWDMCSPGARKLHTRNVYQIVGTELSDPVKFVVCWTVGGNRTGGTGQALRIAEYLEIPIFDLAIPGSIELLTSFVNDV